MPNDGRVGLVAAGAAGATAGAPPNDNVLVVPNNGADVVAGCAPPKDKDVPVVAGVPNVKDEPAAGAAPKIEYYSISLRFKQTVIKKESYQSSAKSYFQMLKRVQQQLKLVCQN